MTKMIHTIPNDLPGRLRVAGQALYGSTWRARLAAGLGVSRSTLFEWMQGANKRRDIDAELIDLLDCERDAANERGLEIAELRRRFIERARRHVS